MHPSSLAHPHILFIDAVRIELEKDMDTDDTIIRLQKRLSRDIKHGHSLDDAFRHFDRNGDGELDIDEGKHKYKYKAEI